jgi:hypothetical protein
MTLELKILSDLATCNGQSDRQLAQSIFADRYRIQQINSECRYMRDCGKIDRRPRVDGIFGNFIVRPKPDLKLV